MQIYCLVYVKDIVCELNLSIGECLVNDSSGFYDAFPYASVQTRAQVSARTAANEPASADATSQPDRWRRAEAV